MRRPASVPPEVDISAFRIVQEAVTNVVRHAGTHECRVVVGFRDGELSIEVTDDGYGAAGAGTGYGITGMRERVGLLGGRFDVGPRPEGGFRVAARFPLPAPARRPPIAPGVTRRLIGEFARRPEPARPLAWHPASPSGNARCWHSSGGDCPITRSRSG